MFVVNTRITIGAYTFQGGFSEFSCRRSIYEVVDTGTLTIPALGRVLQNNKPAPLTSQETAGLFKQGDKVLVEAGYNGVYKKEFEGFVRRVSATVPVVLELEGYGFLLRKKQIATSYRDTTCIKVLQDLVAGTAVTLSPQIKGDFVLKRLTVPKNTALDVLDYFKNTLLQTVYMKGKELYVGIQQGAMEGQIKYRIGYNCIRDSSLKYRDADDSKVQVQIIRKGDKGANDTVLLKYGDDDANNSEIIKKEVANIQAKDRLELIAKDVLQAKKYTGYEGKLTGFLEPYCEPGYRADIEDPRYPKRNGSYFVAATEVRINMSGARRYVELKNKI